LRNPDSLTRRSLTLPFSSAEHQKLAVESSVRGIDDAILQRFKHASAMGSLRKKFVTVYALGIASASIQRVMQNFAE
jgi:hypothetical protein